MKKRKLIHAGDFSHIQEFALSASELSHETFGFKVWGKEDLKKVCTVAMGYTSNGDDYQSSYI